MSTIPFTRSGEQLGTGTRLPILLLVDVSSSMKDQIKPLMDAVARWAEQLRNHDLAPRIDLAMIVFGNKKARLLNLTGGPGEPSDAHAFVPVTQVQLPPVTAYGNTPLGLGITRALQVLPAHKEYLRDVLKLNFFRPLIWILTDGYPNDDWQGPAAKLADAQQGDHALVFAVGFGNADAAVLAELAPDANFPAEAANFDAILRMVGNSVDPVASGAPASEVKRQVSQSQGQVDDIETWLKQSERA